MGAEQRSILAEDIMPNWNRQLDTLPESVKHRPLWQYRGGNPSSIRKSIIGSVVLSTRCEEGGLVQIRHVIIDGSSPLVIGRNFTRNAGIIDMNGNYLSF